MHIAARIRLLVCMQTRSSDIYAIAVEFNWLVQGFSQTKLKPRDSTEKVCSREENPIRQSANVVSNCFCFHIESSC